MELVGLHVTSFAEVNKIKPSKVTRTGRSVDDILRGKRVANFVEHGSHEAKIFDLSLIEPEMVFTGPAIIENGHASVVVFPNTSASVDEFGNIHILMYVLLEVLTLTLFSNPDSQNKSNQDDPITREIISSSLITITEEMFVNMKRTAMSSIIYEVLDMGTGITDKNGDLLSSGCGIPVFVNTLSYSIKAIVNKFKGSSSSLLYSNTLFR